MGTIIVGIILLGIVGVIVGGMIKKKKKGQSIHCSCGCDACGKSCH